MERQFYRLGYGEEAYWQAQLVGPSEVADWDRMNRYHFGEERPVKPVRLRLKGTKKADFIVTNPPLTFNVSERVVALFRANEFSGWGTFPIQFVGRRPRDQGYLGAFPKNGHAVALLTRFPFCSCEVS